MMRLLYVFFGNIMVMKPLIVSSLIDFFPREVIRVGNTKSLKIIEKY